MEGNVVEQEGDDKAGRKYHLHRVNSVGGLIDTELLVAYST